MQIRLIVPSHNDDIVKPYRDRLIAACGGATQTQGQGYWQDAHGNVVYDDVTILDADATDARPVPEYVLWRIARDIAKDLHQDCTYLRIGNDVHFVDRQGFDA